MNDTEWLASQFDGIKDHHEVMTVSNYAEQNRYLPSSVTPMAGYYSFGVTPYIKEIADCMSLSSPVRVVAIMKGVQVGMTVGLLENTILYAIGHVKTAPIMSLTADSEIAKLRIDQYVMPMLEHSGMSHLIQSNEGEKGSRKTGKTKDKISFQGGGFLLPFGANNASKLRSFSIQYLLIDEPDGFKTTLGKDGDPVKLAFDRTAAYAQSRKICLLSTPTIKGQSKIEDHYELGDQRKYFVPCKHCQFPQELEWNMKNKETGEIYGLVFNHDDGVLDVNSVRYICKNCGGEHKNADKQRMLKLGKWKPTATPKEPNRRSYHVGGLYSPVGFKSWEDVVIEWFDCWDVVRNNVKSVEKLQVFMNNNLGKTFRKENEKLKLSAMYGHRRTEYNFGQIPNFLANRSCDSEIMLLTCAVDIHDENLAVAVFGWTAQHRAFLIDYWRIEGDCSHHENEPWQELKSIIYNKVYVSEDGKKYPIQLTVVDSGYKQHVAVEFCESTDGTIPIKGLEGAQKGAQFSEFKQSTTQLGTIAFNINTDLYKERWYSSLKRPWIENQKMQEYCFNVPADIQEKQLKELTAETKVPDKNKETGAFKGWKWHRSGDNELWDLLVYNNAAIDILAWDIMVRQGERDTVNWLDFWTFCREGNNGSPVYYEV
jgi:phage terminase large subunit GpA-like protein